MKKLLGFLLVIVCLFSLAACNKEVTIRSIDLPRDVGFAAVIECFYEDDDNLYYFPYPYSKALTVTYSNGESEPFDQALKEGRATIADLDKFGIKYYSQPKNNTDPLE